MILLEGKTPAKAIRAWIGRELSSLAGQHGSPNLVSINVGEDPASARYRQGQISACQSVGINTSTVHLPIEAGEAALAARIKEVSASGDVDGVILQTPLPGEWKIAALRELMNPEKDVEGVHPENLGRLMLGRTDVPLPCTAWAVMNLLDWYGRYDLTGQTCVVVGNSTTVGRPLTILLSQRNATILQLRSSTEKTHFPNLVSFGNLVVSAAGVAGLIKGYMVRSGSWIVDVGMNLAPDGSMVGDVEQSSIGGNVAAITPVPGGVGPMTVTLLLANLLSLFAMKKEGAHRWLPRMDTIRRAE